MDSRLPHYRPDPNQYPNDSAREPEMEDANPGDESLMEALSEHISRDPQTDEILGCNNDFRLTQEVLRRHSQEDVANEVVALLRTQGAHCDCEVLLNSRIDLIFLEDDDDELEDESEDELTQDLAT